MCVDLKQQYAQQDLHYFHPLKVISFCFFYASFLLRHFDVWLICAILSTCIFKYFRIVEC